jgi:hypothetical protein
MNNKRHKNITVALGAIILASLCINLIQIFIMNPSHFMAMFNLTRESGLAWIPYIQLIVIIFTIIGTIGLMKYKKWGFYSIYISFFASFTILWFPFFPNIISAAIIFGSFIMLFIVFGMITTLIYLHVTGKRAGYFV